MNLKHENQVCELATLLVLTFIVSDNRNKDLYKELLSMCVLSVFITGRSLQFVNRNAIFVNHLTKKMLKLRILFFMNRLYHLLL